jgi:Ricin-type beta-trefoil lectin domain-like
MRFRTQSRRALLGLALAGATTLAAGGTAAADYIFAGSPPFQGTPRVYQVIEAKHSKLLLNVPEASTVPGTKVIQWSNRDAMNSQWEFIKITPTSIAHVIRNRWSRQCLDGQTQDPGPVVQRPCDGKASQRWLLEGAGSHRYIKNEHSFLDLNISGGSTALGGELIQYPRSAGAPNTLFKVEAVQFVAD